MTSRRLPCEPEDILTRFEWKIDRMYRGLSYVFSRVESIYQRGKLIMEKLDQILAALKSESDTLDAVASNVATLKQQLADALSGANLPPAVQEKVDAILSGAQANLAKATAIVTPPTPPTPPA